MKSQKKPLAKTRAKSRAVPAGKPAAGSNQGAKECRGIGGFLRSASWCDWLFGFFLVAAIMVAYHPAWHGGFIWDDDAYVSENPLLTASDGLRRIWFSFDSPSQYFPLTYTTFYLEHSLWGLNPTGYHLVNLLLHAANALLVWQVLRRLRVPGAWLAGAIFALHPVQVESVAWITERKNVLMGFFFLLTLWAWIHFIEDHRKRPWRFYLIALIFYALALSAKTTACTLPAALLLILWLKKMPIDRRRLAQVTPFMGLAVGMGLLTIWWERYHQGTQGKLFEIELVERVLIASRAVWFYAGKLLWPTHLTFSYPRWTISASDPGAYGWVLAVAALGGAIWWSRRWVGRSVESAAVYFAATLSPMLGFIMLFTFRYSFVADHYQYLACVGPIALAAAAMEIGLGRNQAGKSLVALGVGGALLLGLGAMTWKQCGMYANVETLWETTAQLNPDSWIAHGNLGEALAEKGKVDEAILHFQKALRLNPDYGEAYSNFGGALEKKGRLDEAMVQYQKALQLAPGLPATHYNLGNVLAQKGKLDEAIAHYKAAAQIPWRGLPETYYHLGKALAQKGSTTEAITQFQKALQIRPSYAQAHAQLGIALAQEDKLQEATAQFRNVLQVQPNDAEAHYNLGLALDQKGELDEAASQFQEAIRLKPAIVLPYNSLGKTRAKQNKLDDAIALFSKAIALYSDFEEAHYNLGNAYMLEGKTAEAIPELRTTLRLKPDHIQAQERLGEILLKMGKAAEALPYCEFVAQARPHDARARLTLGLAYMANKRPEPAVSNLKEALRLTPDAPQCLNALAWIFATNPRAELRDGAEAVRLAEQACKLTQRKNPMALDTLAAAYAEAGRFDAAIKASEELRTLALSSPDPRAETTARQRLEKYKAHKPYRDEP